MKEASSEARKSTAAATSSGDPSLPNGIFALSAAMRRSRTHLAVDRQEVELRVREVPSTLLLGDPGPAPAALEQ